MEEKELRLLYKSMRKALRKGKYGDLPKAYGFAQQILDNQIEFTPEQSLFINNFILNYQRKRRKAGMRHPGEHEELAICVDDHGRRVDLRQR